MRLPSGMSWFGFGDLKRLVERTQENRLRLLMALLAISLRVVVSTGHSLPPSLGMATLEHSRLILLELVKEVQLLLIPTALLSCQTVLEVAILGL